MPITFASTERIKSPGGDIYVVETVLNRGAFAHSARAKSTKNGGRNVFLKRYFAPSVSLPWYQGFVRHQKELKRRISENDSLQQYCYQFVDFFEGTEGRSLKTFHQVFEFIENGKALSKFIEEIGPMGVTAQWEQRVRFARVMMMGVAALHGQKVVHTDLKPDNLLLIPNPVAAGEYHLKIIDLDWSIFSDQRAPWHGIQGYVGTPMYQSPEHVRGSIPDERSDVFTCALMLGELLGNGHPFAHVSDYVDAVTREKFELIRLAKPLPKAPNTPFVEEMLNRALHANPVKRPTALELRDALFGRGKAGDIPEKTMVEVRTPPPTTPPSPPSLPLQGRAVQLQFEGRTVLTMQIETVIGRQLLKPISSDSQFASDAQFRIHRARSNHWMVSPCADCQNETLVNGAPLTTPTLLQSGMRIGIGNSAKSIEKLPLVVQLVP